MNIKDICKSSWSSFKDSFDYLWGKLSAVLPSIIIAVIILIIGAWIAVFVGNRIADLMKKSKFDVLLENTIFYPLAKVLGIKVNSAKLVGESIKWLLLASVLIAVFNTAGFPRVVEFFGQILSYTRQVFLGAFIVVVGALLANFVSGLITVVTKGEHEYLSTGTKLSINTFALLAALGHFLSPLANAVRGLMGNLGISGMRADALFIGFVVIAVFAFRDIIVSAVKDLYDEVKRARSRKGSRLEEIVKVS